MTGLLALAGATYALWPSQPSAVAIPAGTERAKESTMVPSAPSNPARPAPQAPEVLPVLASPDLGVVIVAHERPALTPKLPTSSVRSTARPCEPQAPSRACTLTPAVTDEQSRQLLEALQQSGATWCHGDALVLSGLPNAPEISAAPPSLRGDFQLLLTLRGMLRGKKFPPKIKIQCRAR